jgi:phage-related protein
MTDTFTWLPQIDPSSTATLRTRKAQFGDGYMQTVADGINAKVQSWPLTFQGGTATITPLMAFLDSHIGVSFYWTPALDVQGYYQCMAYSLIPHGGDNYTVTATFQQVFKP